MTQTSTLKPSSGNSFIDDNHSDLLQHLDSIINWSLDSWNSEEFKSSIRNFIVDLENHFSHEEIILRGAQY